MEGRKGGTCGTCDQLCFPNFWTLGAT